MYIGANEQGTKFFANDGYTGYQANPQEVDVPNGQAYVVFKSHSMKRHKGFHATYKSGNGFNTKVLYQAVRFFKYPSIELYYQQLQNDSKFFSLIPKVVNPASSIYTANVLPTKELSRKCHKFCLHKRKF